MLSHQAVMRLRGIVAATHMPGSSSQPGSWSLSWKSRNECVPNVDLEPIFNTVAPNEIACD